VVAAVIAIDTPIAIRGPEDALHARVRLRAERFAAWRRHEWQHGDTEPGQGLTITHEEVDRGLRDPSQAAAEEAEFYAGRSRRELADAIRLADERLYRDERWVRLVRNLGLDADDADLLSLLVAGALDPALLRVYGYLHDDARACFGTAWLAARLFGWPAVRVLSRTSALIRWKLAAPLETPDGPWSALAPWSVDPFVVTYLASGSTEDMALGRGAELSSRSGVAGLLELYPETLREMREFYDGLPERAVAPPVRMELVGPPGSGRGVLAAQFAASLGRDMVVADAAQLLRADLPAATVSDNAVRVSRLGRLMDAAVCWKHAEAAVRGALSPIEAPDAPLSGGPTDLTILSTLQPLPADNAVTARRAFRLPPLDRSARATLWHTLTGVAAPGLVRDWKLTPGEVATAAQSAPAGEQAVSDVLRELLYQAPGELFTPLVTPYSWDDIVLAPSQRRHLQELADQARLRADVYEAWGFGRLFPIGRGLTALFCGPSGTGKTMAAQVIANHLGLELYRVDLAGVINKYVGETEKHLRQVFDACERANILLFFDEADALFGQRTQVKDAHDRYANIEVDYLLQRMEQFDGIAILATNRKNDIDKAFLRRLRFVIDFVHPGPEERKRLWELSLAPAREDGRDLLGPIDWDQLADNLPMTGADIKNAALAAAFRARATSTAIGMQHILTAARRELTKQGTVLRLPDWEEQD
jgi:adenylate kinase family enzyme